MSIEQRYRANLRAIVQAKIDAGSTMAQLARDCFHDDTPDTRKSNRIARRELERQLGTAPEDRGPPEGVKWVTLERLARGLGCSVKDLFG